jgi:hypothetical protein
MVFVINRRTARALVDVAVAAQVCVGVWCEMMTCTQAAGIARIVYEHDAVSQRCASRNNQPAGAVVFAECDVTAIRVGGAAATLDDVREVNAIARDANTQASVDDEVMVALVATSERVVGAPAASTGETGARCDVVSVTRAVCA